MFAAVFPVVDSYCETRFVSLIHLGCCQIAKPYFQPTWFWKRGKG